MSDGIMSGKFGGVSMKYPSLVRKQDCKTPAEIELEREGVTKYGEPLPKIEWSGKCNYQDKAKVVYTKEKKEVVVTGKLYIPGDIAPELSVITSGKLRIFGEERIIFQGTKARNPDGTVNYTELEVM